MIFAGPSIYIDISERIVREVRAPKILHSRVITLPSKMLTIILEARKTYFEVYKSPPFLDNFENMLAEST
jgi:hypothetical protein